MYFYLLWIERKWLAMKYLFGQQTAIDWRNSVLFRLFIESRDSHTVSSGVYVYCVWAVCAQIYMDGFRFCFSLFFLLFHWFSVLYRTYNSDTLQYEIHCTLFSMKVPIFQSVFQFDLCAIFGCVFSKDGYINRFVPIRSQFLCRFFCQFMETIVICADFKGTANIFTDWILLFYE